MNTQTYQVTRKANRNGAETTVARGISLEAAVEAAFRMEQLQYEHSTGADEFIVEAHA
jgi:hypothetical protein